MAASEPSKSPSMTLNSARAKPAATAAATTKKPRRNKDKAAEDKKKAEADEGNHHFTIFSSFYHSFNVFNFLPSSLIPNFISRES
jgi:hypothetical protein